WRVSVPPDFYVPLDEGTTRRAAGRRRRNLRPGVARAGRRGGRRRRRPGGGGGALRGQRPLDPQAAAVAGRDRRPGPAAPRPPAGERVEADVPHGHGHATTLAGSLRLDGTTTELVYEGGMDVAAFETYVGRVLVPTLRPGDVVLMDNLAAHKAAGPRALVE